MLLFNDAWSCREYSVRDLSLPNLIGNAERKQNPQDLRPLLLYRISVSISKGGFTGNGSIREYALASEYSLAISATASPILFLTLFVDSDPSASISFALMAKPCSCGNDRKSSMLSPLASLRAFEAIRRKMTAAKARVCCSGMCQRKGAFARIDNRGMSPTVGSLEP